MGQRDTAVMVAVIGVALLACSGGANQNEMAPGDGPGGVAVGAGEIAVAPVGGYLLFQREDRLAVTWPLTGAVRALPVVDPGRLAFARTRSRVFVTSTSPEAHVAAVDVETGSTAWTLPIADARIDLTRLAVQAADRFLVVSSGSTVHVIDAATGREAHRHELPLGVIDLDVLADGARVVATTAHRWIGDAPETVLAVLDLVSGDERRIEVPNCSDQLVVTRDGGRAFLAPTTCSRDPVSVIELAAGSERFTHNLPGFGPVALAADGSTAVAFIDTEAIDPALFDDPARVPTAASPDERFQLMLIDSGTLAYEFVPAGADLPRYAVTPSGEVLLVDAAWFDSQVRLLDVASRTFREVSGPTIALWRYALTRDSRLAFVLSGSGLYQLDVPAAQVVAVELDFAPLNLNIAPDDRELYLRQSSTELCVFDLDARACRRTLVLGTL